MVPRVPRPANDAQARKRDGAFYTSPEVVKLMVRLALGNYLLKYLEDNRQNQPDLVVPVTALERLVWDHQVDGLDKLRALDRADSIHRTDISDSANALELSVRKQLLQALNQVTILDPAVGQGAFLQGAVEELVKLRMILGDVLAEQQLRQVVSKENLFGVDRNQAAVKFCQQQGLSNVTCADSLLALPAHWGQFDIVLANPPYVRQEYLAISYKKSLVQQFQALGIELKERSDLYVYFFARLGTLLKLGGTGVIIASSAWLDVDYGGSLQAYLLKNYYLKVILESACERWFSEAGINTGIVV